MCAYEAIDSTDGKVCLAESTLPPNFLAFVGDTFQRQWRCRKLRAEKQSGALKPRRTPLSSVRRQRDKGIKRFSKSSDEGVKQTSRQTTHIISTIDAGFDKEKCRSDDGRGLAIHTSKANPGTDRIRWAGRRGKLCKCCLE